MTEKHTDPRMQQFEQDCTAAGTTPEAVLSEAGLHRSAWYRWKSGAVSPTLRNWDAVQDVLVRKRSDNNPPPAQGAAA